MIVPGWDTASEFTDMDKERTPYELTLGWNVKVDREDDFAGKEALIKLKAQGPRFRMKGFTINNDCSVEDGQPLYADINGERTVIGALPSVIWKAEAEQWLGFSSIRIEHADVEKTYILDDDKAINCEICKLPFINLEHRNQVPAPL